jgi:hypothetical protein
MTLQQRLRIAMRDGNLRVADLARWFDRPDPTVRDWVVRGKKPNLTSSDQDDLDRRIGLLERLIKRGRHFPLPPRLPPAERIRRVVEAAAET